MKSKYWCRSSEVKGSFDAVYNVHQYDLCSIMCTNENKLINVTKMLLLDLFVFALKFKSAELTQLLY